MPSPNSPFAPFSNQRYLTYWLTGLIANFGWLIQLVGASWLMTSIGGTPELVALVQTAVALPMMVFSLPAGALADVFGRRTTVLWSQSILFVISATLAVCAYFDLVTPWGLLVFTFLIGSCKALNHPGWQSYVNEFMRRDELPAAVALSSMGYNLGRSLGPAIGGVIVAAVGAFAAFLVNAIANIGVIIAAWRWPKPESNAHLPPEPVGAAVLAGIRYVALSRVQIRILTRSFSFNITAIAVMALLPLVARDLVGGGARTYGLLFASFGVGAVTGAFFAVRLRAAMSREAQARTTFLIFAAATAAMGLSRSIPLTMLCTALCGGSWMLTQSALNAGIQMSSPRWVVSRSLAFYQSVVFGAGALGSWLWGLLAGEIGISATLLAAGACVAAAVLIGFVMPLRDFDTLGLDPSTPWTPPNTAIDMLPKSGPIITTVEYHIRPDDIPRFLELMGRRRRQRLRDGARRWTLSRDIQNPEIWLERYKSANWTEVERHHTRRTVSGAHIIDELRELNQNGERPSVHYELVRDPEATRDSEGGAGSIDP